MELVIAFVIVAIIGYFIMTGDRSKPGCFAWCDVGRALLLWGMGESINYMIKGPIMKVRVVE